MLTQMMRHLENLNQKNFSYENKGLETSDFSDSVKARLSMIGDLTFLDARKWKSWSDIKKYDIIWFRLGYEVSTNTINFSEAKAKYLVTPVLV